MGVVDHLTKSCARLVKSPDIYVSKKVNYFLSRFLFFEQIHNSRFVDD